jgi:putative restriction endonuclease
MLATINERDERRRIYRCLLPFFGKILPASFYQKTSKHLPDVERIHPLIEGIYKPKWSVYALTIASMLKSPYADSVKYNPDHSWQMLYSPKAGSMDLSANSALLRCHADRQPLLVLRQISDKSDPLGARHRLLGLGSVDAFDLGRQLFQIRGLLLEEAQSYLEVELTDDLLPSALRLEALEDWQPFLADDRTLYRVSANRRDRAFREVVLEAYNHTCAATEQQFQYGGCIEAEAAHIIPKELQGTDDPRNGLALSRSVHWAFDAGLFTISTRYEVQVHPKAYEARHRHFRLLDMDRKQILLPSDTAMRPHPEALEWHRENRFGRFLRPA